LCCYGRPGLRSADKAFGEAQRVLNRADQHHAALNNTSLEPGPPADSPPNDPPDDPTNPGMGGKDPRTPNDLGGPIVRASLYGFDGGAGVFPGVIAAGSQNNGYRLSSTAGVLFGPTAQMPGYRSFDSGGGLKLSTDVSRIFGLPANQHLFLNLIGGFDSNDEVPPTVMVILLTPESAKSFLSLAHLA
jgi:hypothetical protein